MPIDKKNVKISIPVHVKVDKRSSANLIRDIKNLEKDLGPIHISFKDIVRNASDSVKTLKQLSTSAKKFSSQIASTIDETNKGIQKTDKLVDKRSSRGRSRGTPKIRETKQTTTDDSADTLSNTFDTLNKSARAHNQVTERTIKAQEQFQKSLRSIKAEEFKRNFKKISDSIPRMLEGGIHSKGSLSSSVGGVSDLYKGLRGILSRQNKGHGLTGGVDIGGSAGRAMSGGGAASAEGGMAAGMGGGGMAVLGAIGIAAVAIMSFLKVLEMASQSQVKLNKALVEGTSMARDFGLSAGQYGETINDLRNAVQNSTGSMLDMGATSEHTAQVINSFAKESTGSLAQTRNELYKLGTGDIKNGVIALTKASVAYGKALGIGVTEAAAMMGKFTNELGYSTKGSIDAMENIVKAAASANMPMTKFMGVFNQVIPDIQLYQNRLEELIGTIKLLSKTMSARDVKNFMDSFSQGFKTTDFRQRLKTALVVGTGNVSKALEKDFNSKARAMAKNFSEYGIDTDEFMSAMKGGEQTMSELISKAQAAASGRGQQVSGTAISDAMKLASYEKTRQKGGALNVATAMRGGGTIATYNILKQYGQTLTKGFDGLSEHVMKQLGISEQQYEALRTTAQTLKVQRADLSRYGKTNDKTMNTALRETVKLRRSNMSQEEIEAAMRNASDDELMAASELSVTMQKGGEKSFELAKEQYNVTTSIGDKLDNVISFLLEQILRVLNPLLDVANNMLSWIMGGRAEEQKNVDKTIATIKGGLSKKDTDKTLNTNISAMVDSVGEVVKRGLAAGDDDDQLAKTIKESGVFGDTLSQVNPKELFNMMMSTGKASSTVAAEVQEKFLKAQKGNDTAGMIEAIKSMPGDFESNIIKIAKKLGETGTLSEAAKNKISGSDTVRSDAKKSLTAQQKEAANKAEEAARVASNIADLNTKISEQDFASMKTDKNAIAIATGAPLPVSAPPGVMTFPEETIKGSTSVMTFPEETIKGSTGQKNPVKESLKLNEETVKESLKLNEETVKTVAEQLTVQEKDYQSTTDMLSLFKKGIKFEQSWMGTKYKNTLKDASLEAFRIALLEFAIIEEKIKSDTGLREAILGPKGGDLASSGILGWNSILGSESGKALDKLHENQIPGFATGGDVSQDMIAKVHAGEYVVPRGGALVQSGNTSNKSININVTINAQTDASAHQIAEAIHNIHRQH